MFERILQLSDITSKKSSFLFGPRQTGKSTLIKQQLPAAPTYNLLDSSTFRRVSADPEILRRELLAKKPDLKGLHALQEEIKGLRGYVVYLGTERQMLGNIEAVPLGAFLMMLWNRELKSV